MKPAFDQLEAINHRGSSLLLSASAGSGKTEVLARRCVSLLLDPRQPLNVTQLLVMTFTRAAAAELRVRIGRVLRSEIERTHEPEMSDHIARQIAMLDNTEIGTIDAWCQRIVRENAAVLDLDPRFSILDEQQTTLIRSEALDDVFRSVYEAPEATAAAAREWIERCLGTTDHALRDMVLQLNSFRTNLVDPTAWLALRREECARSPETLRADAERRIATELDRECTLQLEALPSDAVHPGVHAYRELLRDVQTQSKQNGGLLAACNRAAEFKWPRKKKGEPDDALAAEVKERWFNKRLKKWFDPRRIERMLRDEPLIAQRVITLIDLESRFTTLLDRAKRTRNAYEFGDVQRFALQLLAESDPNGSLQPSQIALDLRDTYEHVLIDECQDTSAVQIALLRLITRPEIGRTNCFMVGDVKQSIYGFRQANPQLFADIMREFAGGSGTGRVLQLTSSFRSHADIVRMLNAAFAGLFDERFGGAAYTANEQLRAAREDIENPALTVTPRMRIQIITSGESDETESDEAAIDDVKDDAQRSFDDLQDDRMEREARLIAREIREALPKLAVPDRDPDGNLTLRQARLDDFAILLRSARSNAVKVAAILRDEHVEACTVGREEFLWTTEGNDILNVLRVIVNRRQDLPLAAFLRSPFAELGETDLLAIRRAHSDGDYLAACEHYRRHGTDAGTLAKLNHAFERLDRWARAARDEDIPTLLERLLRDVEYELFSLGTRRGAQRVATLNALREFVRVFSITPQPDLATFVAYVDRLDELDTAPLTTIIAAGDAVRIMTIHQAKGLEFPFVILAGAGARFNDRSSRQPLICDESAGIGLSQFDVGERRVVSSSVHDQAARIRAHRDREEELRLLYVAATRAREMLWIVGHGDAEKPLPAAGATTTGPLPHFARGLATSALDWLMMSARRLQGGEYAAHLSIQSVAPVSSNESVAVGRSLNEPPSSGSSRIDPNDDWIKQAVRAILAPPPLALSAVISVSGLKELADDDPQADKPDSLDVVDTLLNPPPFALEHTGPDGRTLGTAVHRFLQHADVTALTTADAISREVVRLTTEGMLRADEAAIIPIDGLQWLMQSPIGEMLQSNADRLRREVPFSILLAGGANGHEWDKDALLTRGVMDCLIELPDGLILIDYKTDRIRTEAAWQERLAAYRAQLSVYAHAAARIFGKPLLDAWLVFLRESRIERVQPSLDFLDRHTAPRGMGFEEPRRE